MRTTRSRTLLTAALGFSVIAVPVVAAPMQRHSVGKADALRAKLAARTDAVDAKLTAARTAGRVSVTDAGRMKKKLGLVRMDSARYVKQQGFLSAGESASYNRILDEIEAKLR